MPKGANGERRPADAIGLAVHIGSIATGEIEDERERLLSAAAEMRRADGKKCARTCRQSGARRLRMRQRRSAGVASKAESD
jgi:hypothetical protein